MYVIGGDVQAGAGVVPVDGSRARGPAPPSFRPVAQQVADLVARRVAFDVAQGVVQQVAYLDSGRGVIAGRVPWVSGPAAPTPPPTSMGRGVFPFSRGLGGLHLVGAAPGAGGLLPALFRGLHRRCEPPLRELECFPWSGLAGKPGKRADTSNSSVTRGSGTLRGPGPRVPSPGPYASRLPRAGAASHTDRALASLKSGPAPGGPAPAGETTQQRRPRCAVSMGHAAEATTRTPSRCSAGP